MVGRNENTVKNRYNCLIKRAKKDQRFPILSCRSSFSSSNITCDTFKECDSMNQEEIAILDSILD